MFILENGNYKKVRIHDGNRYRLHLEAVCDTCHKTFYPRLDAWKWKLKYMNTDNAPYECHSCTVKNNDADYMEIVRKGTR